MGAPVDFIPNLFSADEADAAFVALRDELEWERREDAPRCEYYSNDTLVPYTYGRGVGVRTYEPRPWHPVVLDARARLEERYGCLLDVCFLNRYLDARDWLGWHADDGETMSPDRPIASVSLGAERAIQFRPIGGSADDVEELMLTHGSAAVMLPGMQQTWMHRIPKAGRVVGERISLTFRGFVLSG